MSNRYVKAIVSTEGGASVAQQSYSNIGLVGRALGSGFTVDTKYQIDNPRTAKDLFGVESALYKSILHLFENGATTVYAVPADVTSETQVTKSGDDNTVEFDIGDIPSQPLDSVTIASVPQVEGTDFIVDYGNGKITFTTAPPTGTDNIAIDFSKHTVAQIQSALSILELKKNIQIVLGAMMFESTLLSEIKDHADTMLAVGARGARMAVFMLKKGETTTTLATTLAGYKNILIAHNSLEDVASILAGRIAGLRPWDSLIKRSLEGLNQTLSFTPTEQGNFDDEQIIFTYEDNLGFVVSTAFTLDSTGNLLRIDRVRTLLYIAAQLEASLDSINVIGTLRMNLNGLSELNSYIESVLQPFVNIGAINSFTIDNPAYTLFSKTDPTQADQAAKSALQITPRLEGTYVILIGLNYSGTMEYIELNVSLSGA